MILNEIVPISGVQRLSHVLIKEGAHLTLPYVWEFKTDNGVDFQALLRASDKTYKFSVQLVLRPNVKTIDQLKANKTENGFLPLLVTANLSKDLIEYCQKEDISCIDCNGRAWIHAPGLLIDRDSSSKKYRLSPPPPDIFARRAQRLARTLLASSEDKKWTQTELSKRTHLSIGLVSLILNEMELRGWARGRGERGQWSLTNAEGLLDAWAVSDKWRKRGIVQQYATLLPNHEAIAGHLNRQFGHAFQIVFTQWIAAELRHPYANVPVISAYCKRFPTPLETESAGLREVSDGGTIWLIMPNDEGVFLETREVNGIKLVSDTQIYLDLLQVGFRGPDQAQVLRQWEGFRK